MIKIGLQESEQSKNLKKWIVIGADLIGSVGGALIQASLAGNSGILIGTAETAIIKEALAAVGNEVANRVLGSRQKVRVGATFHFAISQIDERITNGDVIRQDDFFLLSNRTRPAAEELFEGILLKAQNEYEESKVRHYGYLFANICFNPMIDQGTANFLLRVSERLSYRQFCLLELFFQVDYKEIYKINDDFIRMPLISTGPGATGLVEAVKSSDLLQEIRELKSMSLVRATSPSEDHFYSLTLTETGLLIRENLLLLKLMEKDLKHFALQITSKVFL